MTALSRDIPAYGARAVRQLLELINGKRPASSEDEPPHLIPRGTTGRP
jgi:DNA-binding LacI/PurR family transcriptional regulator